MKNDIQKSIHNDELDLKIFFTITSNYIVSITFIAIIFLIVSGIFAYYKPNIYASNTTIQVLRKNVITKAFGQNTTDINDIISILTSRYIVQKALETLDVGTIYYNVNSHGKKTEVYQNLPFIVTHQILSKAMYSRKFILKPIDNKHFLLKIKQPSMWSIRGIFVKLGLRKINVNQKTSFQQVCEYNKSIHTQWFTFTIKKLKKLRHSKYIFYFIQKKDYYKKYSAGLKATLQPKSSIITLTYQDHVAIRAKTILNAIVQEYIYENMREKTLLTQKTLNFINSQLKKVNLKLSTFEQNLQNYKIKNNIVNINRKASLSAKQVTNYKSKELSIQTEINTLINLQHFINTHKNLNGLILGRAKFVNFSLIELIKKLQKMIDKKDMLLIDYTEIHPKVINITKSITSLKSTIKITLANSIRELRQRDRYIKNILAKYKEFIRALPEEQKTLTALSRPLKVNESIYKFLLKKRAEMAILKSSTITNIHIVDKAIVEPSPIKPKRNIIVLIGLIIGIIIGIAQAFLREFMITTVRTIDDIKKLTSLPLYGVIPLNKDKITKYAYIEAFRKLKTNIQFIQKNQNNKVIVISSFVFNEGKTSTVAHLAKALAINNKKVLALDLDIRNPSLHEQFDLDNDIGIVNYLISRNKPVKVIRKTDIHGLNVITVGADYSNPHELILSKKFIQLLEKLKKYYDYIVIDTPPIAIYTDAMILMKYADITLSIIRVNYTKKEFVENIDNMARNNLQNEIGIVLNATSIKKEYGYGSKNK